MSKWLKEFDKTNKPNIKDIKFFVNSEWLEGMFLHFDAACDSKPIVKYSDGSIPGWCIEFLKDELLLCKLYPMEGHFKVAIIIEEKKRKWVEGVVLPECSGDTRRVYNDADFFEGGKWILLDVNGAETLEDVYRLVAVRVSKKHVEE